MVIIKSHDLPAVIDSICLCSGRPRNINGAEIAAAQEKTMGYSGGLIESHDLLSAVDSIWHCESRFGDIDSDVGGQC